MALRSIKKLLELFCEFQLFVIAMYVLSMLYLQIVVTPLVLLSLLGAVSLNFVTVDTAIFIIGGFAFVGGIIGILWAERIRKKHGIVTFHSYLLSTPEIDGWRDSDGNVIRKR